MDLLNVLKSPAMSENSLYAVLAFIIIYCVFFVPMMPSWSANLLTSWFVNIGWLLLIIFMSFTNPKLAPVIVFSYILTKCAAYNRKRRGEKFDQHSGLNDVESEQYDDNLLKLQDTYFMPSGSMNLLNDSNLANNNNSDHSDHSNHSDYSNNSNNYNTESVGIVENNADNEFELNEMVNNEENESDSYNVESEDRNKMCHHNYHKNLNDYGDQESLDN
jgi:hypothetical protein